MMDKTLEGQPTGPTFDLATQHEAAMQVQAARKPPMHDNTAILYSSANPSIQQRISCLLLQHDEVGRKRCKILRPRA